ncbi:ASCH domain-containing protein [Pseudomonas sp. S10E 269]|uniref:ASCH domain-containing protein n=1 Tax=unclassified Pseudomonas TaxID=196821 RepID=UPI000C25DC94|nr:MULTISPECIES: ASCH domain-containing protein [unclassified Pseudomonas]PJK32516.1 ASCH domain-containing protein [Pseudomonas sp. S09F 262]PJK42004.1 ASCH domain-containing protein [Pseudomonas sp. S10E 269]
MSLIDDLKRQYPGATAWPFGDTPEMADELADRVAKGIKTATCCSLSSFKAEDESTTVGSYSIILNSRNEPVCVVRVISMQIIRYCDVDQAFARKEGEGDLSLRYWRQGHKDFFQREGSFDEAMELVAEEFELVDVL